MGALTSPRSESPLGLHWPGLPKAKSRSPVRTAQPSIATPSKVSLADTGGKDVVTKDQKASTAAQSGAAKAAGTGNGAQSQLLGRPSKSPVHPAQPTAPKAAGGPQGDATALKGTVDKTSAADYERLSIPTKDEWNRMIPTKHTRPTPTKNGCRTNAQCLDYERCSFPSKKAWNRMIHDLPSRNAAGPHASTYTPRTDPNSQFRTWACTKCHDKKRHEEPYRNPMFEKKCTKAGCGNRRPFR